jgi:hypothetical protein
MATISSGQLVAFLPYGLASVRRDPMRTSLGYQNWSARYAGSLLVTGGDKVVSGTTKVGGVVTPRRVVIMTQPPASQVVYESNSVLPGAVFLFPKLAPGNYVVLDIALDGSQQALVYDWVVST